jgi:LEA14-like dessication related protein
VKGPTVDIVGAKLTGLSFQDADLMFDVQIHNPNSIGITLAGFDYDFLVNGESLVSGNQGEGAEIKARSEHVIHFPLSIEFSNLYNTITDLREKDTSAYELNFGFSFSLPLLGPLRVPVSTAGDFPLIKLPSVSLDGLSIKHLGLTGADLELGIRLKNPNAFSLLLEKMNYQLLIGGQPWASGAAQQKTELTEKGDSRLSFPISLNFLEVGSSVYQMLKGEQRLEYELHGDVDVSSTLPLFEKSRFDFKASGLTNLVR